MKLKKGNKYQITWIDTFSYNGWYDENDLIDKAKKNRDYQETIGFYVNEVYGFVIVVGSYNKNPEFSQWGFPKFIPRGCINRIRLLK